MSALSRRSLVRAALRLTALLIVFAAGLAGGWWLRECWISPQQSADRQLLDRARAAGGRVFGHRSLSPDAETLAAFDPSKSDCRLEWTWSNGFAGTENVIALAGNGELRLSRSRQRDGNRTLHDRLLPTLPAAECRALFLEVLTCGILDYSEEAVLLKKELSESRRSIGVDDGTIAELHLVIPDFHLDRRIAIYEIDAELRSHPEIAEFRIFKALEDRFSALTPRE